jgi:hypothetical protein
MLLGNLCQFVLNTMQSLNNIILNQDKSAVTLISLTEINKYFKNLLQVMPHRYKTSHSRYMSVKSIFQLEIFFLQSIKDM